jgi:hypothetical protein
MIGVLKYYTAKAPEYSTSTYTAPSIYTVAPATQLCVLPQPTIPRLPSIKLCFSYYTDDPTYYTTKTSEYYTEAPKYYSSPGDRRHIHIWGDGVFRSPQSLHSCSFVLHLTKILHRDSSLLHHNLRYIELLHQSPEVLHRGGRILHDHLRCSSLLHRGTQVFFKLLPVLLSTQSSHESFSEILKNEKV